MKLGNIIAQARRWQKLTAALASAGWVHVSDNDYERTYRGKRRRVRVHYDTGFGGQWVAELV